MKTKLNIKDIIVWDVYNWSQGISFWESNLKKEKLKNGICLEIGSREGGLSLWLASKGMDVVCSDICNPCEIASGYHNKCIFSQNISYKAIDATDIKYENYFDYVIFKSVLGGIGRNSNKELQIKAIKEIYKSLKPGGKLLFAENLIASPVHQWFRKRNVAWGNSWRYVSIEEIKEYLSIFQSYSLSTYGLLGAFGRYEWQRSILGRFDKLLNWCIPDNWKYICFGVATK